MNQNQRSINNKRYYQRGIMERNDSMDVRFDHKFLQRDIVAQRLEREISLIVPRIVENLSDDVVEYYHECQVNQRKKR